MKYRIHKDSDPAMDGAEPGDLLVLFGFADEIIVDMRDEGEANEAMFTRFTRLTGDPAFPDTIILNYQIEVPDIPHEQG